METSDDITAHHAAHHARKAQIKKMLAVVERHQQRLKTNQSTHNFVLHGFDLEQLEQVQQFLYSFNH